VLKEWYSAQIRKDGRRVQIDPGNQKSVKYERELVQKISKVKLKDIDFFLGYPILSWCL
jgi:hypothetical protein